MMRAVYTMTGMAITPLIRLWMRRRIRRGKEDAARIGERFGYASAPRPAGKLIWLHAASVGEAQSVLVLVRSLLEKHQQIHLLITTGTVTSAALVAQQNLPRVIHQFVPVDTMPSVVRFLRHWQPDIALWVESEFWPQLLWQTRGRHIPLLLINARISARSFAGWRRWPALIRSLLQCFDVLYAGSAEDAKRLLFLGAEASRVQDVGNLKYDAAPLPVDAALVAQMQQCCAHRKVWVAASTHANEEIMIAGVHQTLLQQFPDLLTIIIPRHARRGDEIAIELRARGIDVSQRSKQEPVTERTGIYLADTMGELGSFFHVSDIVFLGGSLIAHGGHNPLEPARFSCALLAGPYTHNFVSIMEHFCAANAIQVVQHADMLAAALRELLLDSALCAGFAERAVQVAQDARGAGVAIVQYVDALLQQCDFKGAA